MTAKFRMAVINSHPIQYFAPLYRLIADTQDIDVTVYYCSRQGTEPGHMDPGFGRDVIWDTPLLDGYRNEFLANMRKDVGVDGFFSLINPAIALRIYRQRFDAVLLHGHNSATNILAFVVAKLTGTRVFMRGETHLLLERRPMK